MTDTLKKPFFKYIIGDIQKNKYDLKIDSIEGEGNKLTIKINTGVTIKNSSINAALTPLFIDRLIFIDFDEINEFLNYHYAAYQNDKGIFIDYVIPILQDILNQANEHRDFERKLIIEKGLTWLKNKSDNQIKDKNGIQITGNNNKVYQNVEGAIIDSSITQTHTGIGDNIAGNKIIVKDNYTDALQLYSNVDLSAKKGAILALKNIAIVNKLERQKIIDFLSSINDWITEDEKYNDLLIKPDIEWTKWKMDKDYFNDGSNVFEKDKQILSIEASKAIDEIIWEHIKQPSSVKLNFYQKNLLGLLPADFDFKLGNIDFTNANLFGAYFLGTRNIHTTNFQYATYYGNTIFRKMTLPEDIYVNHEIGSKYSGNILFMEVDFPKGINLTNSCFTEGIDFLNCVFQKDARFYISTFEKECRFFRCYFNHLAGYNSSTFKGKASFENSAFYGETHFATVKFQKEVNFKGATFSVKPNFRGTDTSSIRDLKY